MQDSLSKRYKFKGGAWIGLISATWPWGVLEFDRNQLTICVVGMKEINFARNEIDKLEIKKYFPIIAYGIRIVPKDKIKGTLLYFWYISFSLKKLTNSLKECGWL